MQPTRAFASPYSSPYSMPPPNLLETQPTNVMGSHPVAMVGPPNSAIARGVQPTNMMGPQPTHSDSSVSSRLFKFRQKVTDGRTCTTAPTLAVKSTHNAFISHVEDGPFNFTIQLKSSVEELLPQLQHILSRPQNSRITTQLIPGSLVTAKSKDGNLRRGVIRNVQPDTCEVYYIDYGNFEELPYSDIFRLSNTAAELSPAMAMQFCLADLKSLKITDSDKVYFARELLGKQVLISVTERESNSPFQYCEIVLDGRNVREMLQNLHTPMQYAHQYPPGRTDAQVSVVHVEDPAQFFVQYCSELNAVEEIQEALAAYCPSQPRITDSSSINVGSPVASIFPDDQKWYRALVMGTDNGDIFVSYVDYGNRAKVKPNQMCLLSRDLVNKWRSQAIECCLIGFDRVTPSLFMANKMDEATLGRTYTLKLHSILSGFRFRVDLIDNQGNSLVNEMKNLLDERQKSLNQPPPLAEKKKPQVTHEDDRGSQHSSDSGAKRNMYQRPSTRGDKGGKSDQYGEKKFDNRNKFEEKQNSYSQHDDRSGNDYKPRNDTRGDWKKGAKKPYMDQVDEWKDDKHVKFDSSQEQKPHAKKESWSDKHNSGGGFKKQERTDDKSVSEWRDDSKKESWGDKHNSGGGFKKHERTDDKSGWGGQGHGSRPDRGDRQFRSDGDRQNGNKFERKPSNINDRVSNDRRFGDRDSRYGKDNKFADRENNKHGSRDRPNSREDRKPKWNDPVSVQSHSAASDECWETEMDTAPVKRPSVVISEYPHQEIKVGEEYKVLFACMETSPRDVYVHINDCDSVLDKIRTTIDSDATATSRPISNAVLAMPVLARYHEDGLLYRATIKSISKLSSGQVDILFVDFGNTAVNALSEVFTISSELMSIPIQAIHVIVSDMPTTPFPNLSACQAHFETGYLTLKPSRTTTINLEQVVEGAVIRPDGKSVAEVIKNDPNCLETTQIVAESPAVQETITADSNSVTEVITSAPESQGVTQMDVKNAAVKQSSLGLWRERLDFLLGQRLFGKVVKKLEGDNFYSVKIGAVLDLIVPAQSVDPLSSDLNPGDDVIVAVESLTGDKLMVKYYNRQGESLGNVKTSIGPILPMQIVERRGVYTVGFRENSTLYLQLENSSPLNELLEDLYEKYENSSADVEEFKVGDYCAAKSDDGNWYRSKITAAVDNVFTVHYLDYGNGEEVRVENLRKLDDEFTSPEMCVAVVLPVLIKDVDGGFEMIGDGPFNCAFIKYDSDNGVWIVDLSDFDSKNLALKLIEAGKAEENPDSDISPDPLRREPSWDLRKGDRVPVVISHVDFPNEFLAHHLNYTKILDELHNQIQDIPDEGGDLGELFLAKYTEDGTWNRAVRVGDRVRFLDFGNQDHSVEIKKLPAKFKHPVNGYAMPLRLCVRASDEWSETSKQLFDSFIDKCGLEAEIISVDFETIVDLRASNESLSQIYLDGGHAVHYGTSLMNRDLFDDIVEDELPKGKISGVVTACTSVNDFYVQENSKMDILDLLGTKLEAADSFEVIENPALGQTLIAKFIDDSIWYRAKVIKKESSETEVIFVDYGNISSATEFRVLPTDLAAFPSLAWHCSLNTEDTPAIHDHFTSLIDADTVFDISFGEKLGDVYIVQFSIDNVCPFDSSTISRTPTVEIVETPPSAEKTEVIQAKPIPPTLTKPLYKNCVLCHSNGPYDFYVQTDDDHIQIEEMANHLFEAGTFPTIGSVKKGDFVVAQFSEDDAYYRAIVTDVEPEVVVHFIDYGNSCPASCFHELPTPLKAIPQLAVRCSLQSPIGGWSVDAIDKFSSLLNSDTKSFDLKIISKGDPSIVDVEINGSSITKQLAPDAKFEPESIEDVKDDDTSLPTSGVCYIASITQKECYIHDSSVSADLDVITEQMASIDVSDENCELKDVTVGDIVGAYHEDVLYRARVTKLDPREVYFIDYGNTSPVDKFFKLPDSIKNKKPLAVKVQLDLGDGVQLNDEGLVEIQTLAADGANYTQTKPSVVELKIGVEKVVDLMKSHLVFAAKSAHSPDAAKPAHSPDTAKSAHSPDAEKSAHSPDAGKSAHSPDAAKSAHSPDAAKSAHSPDAAKPAHSPDTAKSAHSPDAGKSAHSPDASESTPSGTSGRGGVPVIISHVNSPFDFYYQRDPNSVDAMTSRLADEAEGFPTLEKCDVGQVICAKYTEDDQWYRATVITTEPTIMVFFMDYGNTFEVKEMKKLPDDLAEIPMLCRKASLTPQEQPFTQEEVMKFSEIVFGGSSFTVSVILKGEDFVFVRLNSSEVGDVTNYMRRSCSIKTTDSEYCTPECLSVDDIAPSYHCDESAGQDNLSFNLITLPIASVIHSAAVEQAIEELADDNRAHSADLEQSYINLFGEDNGIAVQRTSCTSNVEHHDHEVGSSDELTLVVASKQETSLENSKDLEEVKMDPENIETSIEVNYEGRPLDGCGHIESGGTSTSLITEEPESDQNVDVDSELYPSPNALMSLAQATLSPFLGDVSTNVAMPDEVSPSPTDTQSTAQDDIVTSESPSLALPDTKNEIPTSQESQLSEVDADTPASGSYFSVFGLKETLYSALGYETEQNPESTATNTSNSSGVISQAELERNDDHTLKDVGEQPLQIISQPSTVFESVEFKGDTKNIVVDTNGIVNKDQTDEQVAADDDHEDTISENLSSEGEPKEYYCILGGMTPADFINFASNTEGTTEMSEEMIREFYSDDEMTPLPYVSETNEKVRSNLNDAVSNRSINPDGSGKLENEDESYVKFQSSGADNIETSTEVPIGIAPDIDCDIEPVAGCSHVETSTSTTTEDRESDQNVKVDSELDSSPNALMSLAQATLSPFLGEINTNFTKSGEVSPSPTDTQSTADLESQNEVVSIESVAHRDTTHEILASKESEPPVVDVPASNSIFRLPNLRETLYSALGYETLNSEQNLEVTAPSSSDVVRQPELERKDEHDQCVANNSSTVVHTEGTAENILDDNDGMKNKHQTNVDERLDHAAEEGQESSNPTSLNFSSSVVLRETCGIPSNGGETSGVTPEQFIKFATTAPVEVSEEMIQELHSDDDTNRKILDDSKETASNSSVNPDESGNLPNEDTHVRFTITSGITSLQFIQLATSVAANSTVEIMVESKEIIGESSIDEKSQAGLNSQASAQTSNQDEFGMTQIAEKTELSAATTRNDDEKLPMDLHEVSKTELSMCRPKVRSLVERIETTTVSEDEKMAKAKTTTVPSKRVKTLAEIKANAKSRICTGRRSSPKRQSPHSSPKSSSTKLTSKSAISPSTPKEKERLIPGTVNGRLV